MALLATGQYRIRAGGSNSNGGGFDPSYGDGTDYTDQDAAQLSLTDLATPGAGSTTLTSATGGFTSAMLRNYVRISSGTNFQTGYYRIDAFVSSNEVTLDRTPTSGGAGSGGNGNLGGAFATFNALQTGGSAANPSVASPLVAGNTIYVRGSGGEDPVSADYTSTNYHQFPSGDTTNGKLKVIGYNGRPRIDTNYLMFYALTGMDFENLHWKATGTSSGSFGVVNGSATTVAITNCWLDQNGHDVVGFKAGVVVGNRIFNSGSSSAGTAANSAVYPLLGTVIRNNVINGWRGRGIHVASVYSIIDDNVIVNNKHEGIYCTSLNSFGFTTIRQNTIYGNTGDGVELAAASDPLYLGGITDNIFETNGGYGLNLSAGSTALNDRIARNMIGNNYFYNNTSGAKNQITGTGDVTLTGSAFTNAAGGDFSLNNTAGGGADVRAASSHTFGGSAGTSYRDGGAIQHEDAGGGGGVPANLSGGIFQ